MQNLATPDWITRFRALGDETRLGLLCALLSEELSVGELSEVVQAAQPGVSRHLSALRDAGLVVARKQGATTYYRIQPGDPLRAQLLDQAAGLWALVPLIPRGLRVADIGTGTGGMLPLFSEFAGEIVA